MNLQELFGETSVGGIFFKDPLSSKG